MSDPQSGDRRLRESFLSAESGGSGQGDCPEHEEFFAACRGELPAERRDALLDHALDCAPCTEALALAREVVSGMEQEKAPVTAGRNWGWIGLAAAVLIVSIVAVPRVLRTDDPGVSDSFRAGETRGSLRTLLSDGATLPRDNFMLRWEGAPQGSVYTVEIVTADLRAVDRAENLKIAEYRVPTARLAAFESGTEILWRVDAAHPGGERVESPAFRAVVGD